MRHPILALVLGLLSGAAAAQSSVTGQLVTIGHYGNLVRDGSASDFQSLPPATPIAQNQSSLSANTSNGSAATLIGWRVRNGVLSCDVSEQGTGNGAVSSGTTNSSTQSAAQLSPHELLLTISGTPGLRGKLQLWASGVAMQGATVLLGADVGNDNTLDLRLFLQSGVQDFTNRQWDTRLDANGKLQIRIVTEAKLQISSGNSVYKTGISAVFTPGHYCDMLPGSTHCGAKLTGRDSVSGSLRELVFQVNDAPVNAPALLLFGTQTFAIPLPGTSCFVRTDPLLLLPVATDTYGRVEVKFPWPSNVPLQLRAQSFVVTPQLSFATSDAMGLHCRR